MTISTRPGKRARGAAMVAVAISVAGAMLTPAPASAQPAEAIDGTALALLRGMTHAYHDLKSYYGEMTITVDGDPDATVESTIVWQQPNKAIVLTTEKAGVTLAVSDGDTVRVVSPHGGVGYLSVPAPPDATGIAYILTRGQAFGPGLPVLLLSGADLSQSFGSSLVSLEPGAPAFVDRTRVDTVIAQVSSGGASAVLTYSIGRVDHLLRRVTLVQTDGANVTTVTQNHTNIEINRPIQPSTFTFMPLPARSNELQAQMSAGRVEGITVGDFPLSFGVPDLNGSTVNWNQYKGKVVLLDFWATWCGPCRAAMPEVIKLYNTYHSQGFEIIGISLDQERAALDGYLSSNGLPWRQVYDGKGWKSEVAEMYHINGIPQAFVIGRDGRIVAIPSAGADVTAAVQAAMSQ